MANATEKNGTLRKAGMIVGLVMFFAIVCGTTVSAVSAFMAVKDANTIENAGKFLIVDMRLATMEDDIDTNCQVIKDIGQNLQDMTLQLQRISDKLGIDDGS